MLKNGTERKAILSFEKALDPPGGAAVDKKTASVRGMFNSIAWRYDLANCLLSLGIDRWWRRSMRCRLAARYRRTRPQILDVCCGTGDLAFELCRLGTVTGADFARGMLLHARKKTGPTAKEALTGWIEADVLSLPFRADSFDIVSAAFGIRNLENLERGIAEIVRVLRPGGVLAILEFSMPRGRYFAAFYRFYFRRILPRLGGWITGRPEAYRYLPASVSLFSRPAEVSALLQRNGLVPQVVEEWTGGVVVCYLFEKEKPGQDR
jgi:demethylmenaquinone methyltransferase / 2-methoxy-6-polyprenyl-1,4-benzoquinol methylase